MCFEAKKLKIIMDNLNTHTYSSILETFEFQEALRIIKKVHFILHSKMKE
jgi:hypothetical protein